MKHVYYEGENFKVIFSDFSPNIKLRKLRYSGHLAPIGNMTMHIEYWSENLKEKTTCKKMWSERIKQTNLVYIHLSLHGLQ